MGGDGCSSSSSSAGSGSAAEATPPRVEDARGRSGPATPPKPAEPKPGAAAPRAQPGEQSVAQQPPPAATGDFLRRDTDARWGVLPPKLQERLLNLHVDAIPERYRTWLAAYVRELQRRDAVATGP